jgi:putative aminopeptidase FrvX
LQPAISAVKAQEFCQLAGRLMSCPAAPYHEFLVRAEAELVCREHGLAHEIDPFGNLLVRWQTARTTRPLVLAAHLDHPGFELSASNRLRAKFLGGVADRFFRPGTRLRLIPGDFAAVLGRRTGSARTFELRLKTSTRAALAGNDSASPDFNPTFAVWELEDFAVRGARIFGRACDDLIGAAAVLATLIELKRTRARVNVIGVLARAEEIGFQGALAAAGTRELPRNALVISLETSRELPPVKMGRGVIVRVGDRTSIFNSTATRFLTEGAAALQKRDRCFLYQRALMSGGTCEATAYQELGFQTAAVCVALGNYHNCAGRTRIAEEFVNVADAFGMVRLLVETAQQMKNYARLTNKLPARLRELQRVARKKLGRPSKC